MKDLSEFDTLADAQAEPSEHQIMVTSDRMTMFLIQTGLYAYFMDHTDDICRAVADRIKTTSVFNFMNGHPAGIANQQMVDFLIADPSHAGRAPQLSALKSNLVAYANQEFFPYADVTPEAFDAAKNPPVFTECEYTGGGDHLVCPNGSDIKVVQDVLATDVIYEIDLSTCGTDPFDSTNFTQKIRAGFLKIAAGESAGVLSIRGVHLRKYNRFYIKPNINLTFSAVSHPTQG